MVWDYLFYFVDTTAEDDIKCVTNNPVCPFREYEISRIEHVLSGIITASVFLMRIRKELSLNKLYIVIPSQDILKRSKRN